MYDAIVIGARCAGSSTAMLLARQGHRVLLIDKSPFPSDRVVSTHMIWHAGAAALKRWGLLDAVKATGCESMKKLNLDMGGFVLSGYAPPVDGVDEAIAPRRVALDGVLTQAARDAGAEFRPDCDVTEFLSEDGRLVGVRYTDSDGRETEARARIVIGAEGTHSPLAKHVQAEEYNTHPRHQGTIWAYFSDLEIDEMEFYSRPRRMVYAWGTNHGQVVAGICFNHDDFLIAKASPEQSMPEELQQHAPGLADRIARATQQTPWISGSTIGVMRRPCGPGWALVGDAGLTIDPISAAGISNAFLDAELCAGLLDIGLKSGSPTPEDSLAGFEEKRNAERTGLYEFTKEMSKLEIPPQEMIDLFTALQHSPEGISNYFGIFAQSVTPQQFFDPEHVGRVFAAAAAAATA
jgi:flavin-dependent dehydrogenase